MHPAFRPIASPAPRRAARGAFGHSRRSRVLRRSMRSAPSLCRRRTVSEGHAAGGPVLAWIAPARRTWMFVRRPGLLAAPTSTARPRHTPRTRPERAPVALLQRGSAHHPDHVRRAGSCRSGVAPPCRTPGTVKYSHRRASTGSRPCGQGDRACVAGPPGRGHSDLREPLRSRARSAVRPHHEVAWPIRRSPSGIVLHGTAAVVFLLAHGRCACRSTRCDHLICCGANEEPGALRNTGSQRCECNLNSRCARADDRPCRHVEWPLGDRSIGDGVTLIPPLVAFPVPWSKVTDGPHPDTAGNAAAQIGELRNSAVIRNRYHIRRWRVLDKRNEIRFRPLEGPRSDVRARHRPLDGGQAPP